MCNCLSNSTYLPNELKQCHSSIKSGSSNGYGTAQTSSSWLTFHRRLFYVCFSIDVRQLYFSFALKKYMLCGIFILWCVFFFDSQSKRKKSLEKSHKRNEVHNFLDRNNQFIEQKSLRNRFRLRWYLAWQDVCLKQVLNDLN